MTRQRSRPSSFKDPAEEFTFAQLAAATKGFALEAKIGEGSFGTVYRGKLPDGREVAIKRGESGPRARKFQEKESAFRSELAFLARLHHKHLVGLVGYCEENDECSPPDFYARVGIAGVAADTRMDQTRVIMDNWIPMWDHEFEFPLTVPELAPLRVEVHESDKHQKDDFGGQTCLPVWELRSGIRSVRLCNHKGELLRSVKLLVRFEFS